MLRFDNVVLNEYYLLLLLLTNIIIIIYEKSFQRCLPLESNRNVSKYVAF